MAFNVGKLITLSLAAVFRGQGIHSDINDPLLSHLVFIKRDVKYCTTIAGRINIDTLQGTLLNLASHMLRYSVCLAMLG